MSIHLKNSVTGIDVNIQSLQKFLYKKLKALWPIDDSNFDGYGRVYKNSTDRGYVPELFESSPEQNNTRYRSIYFDKSKKGLFFFSVDDQERYKDGSATIKVFLTFVLNVALIKNDIQHRGDEEVRNDVRKLCSLGLHELTLTGTETGFSNVFKQFTGLVNKDGEIFEDRHPIYCFKINLELMYQPAEINCR